MQQWAAEKSRAMKNIDDPTVHCFMPGVPRVVGMPFPLEIVQTPNKIVILYEAFRTFRVIPTDGKKAGGESAPSFNGDSVGHWEGDTLVVETRNFNGKAPYRGAGVNLHLTERYTRVGADRIDFKVTFEDDTQWTQPWTAEYSMRTGEGELYEYACHEGNYGLRNILENARDEERKAAGATR
jgi:hypothetical protein